MQNTTRKILRTKIHPNADGTATVNFPGTNGTFLGINYDLSGDLSAFAEADILDKDHPDFDTQPTTAETHLALLRTGQTPPDKGDYLATHIVDGTITHLYRLIP